MIMTPVDSLLHYISNLISRQFEFKQTAVSMGMART
jgi:hypothetical protein